MAGVISPLAGMVLQRTTGPAGFTLVNGTPVILTWTAPNDGQLHRFTLFARLIVTSAITGGQIFAGNTAGASPLPGTVNNSGASLFLTNKGAGDYLLGKDNQSDFKGVLGPGETVYIQELTAVTAGAGVVYAEIWGS
jgi:hypothetical protein